MESYMTSYEQFAKLTAQERQPLFPAASSQDNDALLAVAAGGGVGERQPDDSSPSDDEASADAAVAVERGISAGCSH